MKTLMLIVNRYFADLAFRTRLTTEPELALAGYNLDTSDRQLVDAFLSDPQAYKPSGESGPKCFWVG
jgi:hypothetical protein